MNIISMPIPQLPFPAFNCVLTFRPYLRYVEEQIILTKSNVHRKFLQSIATLIKSNPELLQPIKDLSILEKYSELIELVKITHQLQGRTEGKLHTLGIPSGSPAQINYFGYSDEFAEFFRNNRSVLKPHSPEASEEFRRNNYFEILRKAYKVDDVNTELEPMMQWMYEQNGVKHYYKVIRRLKFADIYSIGELPPFQDEWLEYASGAIASHHQLQHPLPLEQFMIEGFFTFSIVEETEQVALSQLNKIVTQLYVSDPKSTIVQLKEATLSLLGSDDIELGFLPIIKINGNFVYHDFYAHSSIVFGKLKGHFSDEELSEIYDYMAEYSSDTSNILSTLDNDVYDMCSDGSVMHIKDVLQGEGLDTLKFIPVWHNNVLLGIIELGGKSEDEINVSVLRKLDAALPVFREFFLYKTNQFNDYMKSFIMQRYTSIQPSVAWKFNEEVWSAMKELASPDRLMNTPPVRFENLYPFYGAIDFRNSTQKQMEAIHADYEAQLHYLEVLLKREELSNRDAEVEHFLSQVIYWQNQLSSEIDIQEEGGLRHFLDVESVSVINNFAQQGKISKSDAREYSWTCTSKYGKFHVFHNRYEESVQELNRILKEELIKAEAFLQDEIPHYFEKFQTDGIEYSLYAGEAINPSRPFSEEAIKDIIDWQVDVMVKMAIAASDYKEHLSVQLETTQLILIHENTVDISYRVDERHFDVEGSYSIRYQVLKKRIDKVHLANSTERLTQPDKIAIVYSNKNSINPYVDKINALIRGGKLNPEIEFLDLEQLQGIGKLKAIRVKINVENKDAFKEKMGSVLTLNE